MKLFFEIVAAILGLGAIAFVLFVPVCSVYDYDGPILLPLS